MILNCFISDLIPKIKRELGVLQPTSTTQAMGLAKLLKSKNNSAKRFIRSSAIMPQLSQHLLPPPRLPFLQPATPSTSSPLPIKNLLQRNFKREERWACVTIAMRNFFLVTNVQPNVFCCCWEMKAPYIHNQIPFPP